ncbi:ATP-dependent Clp protease proteolytic subunit [Parasphingorhabdus halotolerans]|nr:ATP-dependent Clp protease proteolytic subunit [Parasphingorhabdus halotolerans]
MATIFADLHQASKKTETEQNMTIIQNSLSSHLDNDDDEDEKTAGALPGAMMTKFLEARTIMIFGGVDQKLAERVSTQLLYLDHLNNDPIKIFVNSPGGHVESGDTIHDLISYISSPVAVIGTGWVASIATHIFLGVAPERRFCLPNTRFLIHQPSGGSRGKASDIAIQAEEIVKMRTRIAEKIAEATGQSLERVLKDIDRDYWMSTTEAKEYGILGTVINSASEVKF